MAEAGNAAIRDAARKRKIPEGATCGGCGFADARALEPCGEGWQCYECAQKARGKPATEAHHILTRKVSPVTVDVPGNLHRILSEQQLRLPKVIRDAAPHDPIAFVVRLLGAIRDFFNAVADFLGRAIDWLMRLKEWLDAKFGTKWIEELPPLYPEAAV